MYLKDPQDKRCPRFCSGCDQPVPRGDKAGSAGTKAPAPSPHPHNQGHSLPCPQGLLGRTPPAPGVSKQCPADPRPQGASPEGLVLMGLRGKVSWMGPEEVDPRQLGLYPAPATQLLRKTPFFSASQAFCRPPQPFSQQEIVVLLCRWFALWAFALDIGGNENTDSLRSWNHVRSACTPSSTRH